MSLYEISVTTIQNKKTLLKAYQGKVMLIVNTASKCGYTKQFSSLQSLYAMYKHQGFEVLGVPSNQFKQQDPGSNEEILEFCTLHFGVSFTMLKKAEVLGENIHPLFDYLVKNNPNDDKPIQWNFEKFLIDRHGKILKRYPSNIDPLSIEMDIQAALGGYYGINKS